MDKRPPTNNNDILDLLRKSVEQQAEQDEEVSTPEENTAETPDQMLKRLKAQLGQSDNDEKVRESDYDISGFEIEAAEQSQDSGITDEKTKETDIENEDCPSPNEFTPAFSDKEAASLISAENEPSVETETLFVEDEDNFVQAEEAPMPDAVEENTPTDAEIPNKTQETPVAVADNISPEIENAEDESDEEARQRERVALFVEKTINPEEEFDYFAEMDRIAAKRKDAVINAEQSDNSDNKGEDTATEDIPAAVTESEYEIAPQPILVENAAESNLDTPTDPQDDLSEAPCVDHSPNPFFFASLTTPKNDEKDITRTIDGREAENLDDTDINLLIALGKKEAVENSIGFVRVREAKNNFYDPTDEESITHNVFAYDGQEFRSPDQAEDIKTRYRREKKTLYKRMICTLLLAFVLLFIETVVWLDIRIPFVSDFLAVPLQYAVINFLLTAGGLALSAKSILSGLQGFFTMRPNQHTPISMLCAITVIYNILLVSAFREAALPTYNSALLVFLSLAIIGDAMRLTKEILTFDVISDEKEKFSLEKSDTSSELIHEKKMLYKRDLLVERVSFVGRYFNRTARRPAAFTEYFISLLIVLVLSVFAATFVAFTQKSLAHAFHMYTLALFVCIPMQYLLYDIYALQTLSKFLYRHESAIIGENADREYVGANTVYLDDVEMFGHHGVSVSGLRIYDEKNFYHVMYLAQAVFSKLEGPLRYVLESNAGETKKAKEITLENIYANGIEATVDSEHKVLIGNEAFMRKNGFAPKNNEEDEKKVERGELCILHMAVNGELCAKFYLKYTITQRFEKFVAEMRENGTNVGIRTLDPNVTERMIALLRGDSEAEISVIRPTLNDLVPLGRRSDSSIITAKSPHMISRILAQCVHLKKIRRTGTWLRLASSLLGMITLVTLFAVFSSVKIPALLVAVYQLLWLIPSIIYIKVKMK